MFDMESRPTIVKSVVESVESADSTADSATNPLKIQYCFRYTSIKTFLLYLEFSFFCFACLL